MTLDYTSSQTLADSTIVQNILNYVKNNGGDTSSWYVGIATDPRTRLFNDHNVSESNAAWIFRTANSEADARATESYLLRNLNSNHKCNLLSDRVKTS